MPHVTVVASWRGGREETLIDQPLDLDTLALLEPVSPLSRMILNGAGCEYVPHSVTVYVDGKQHWRKACPQHGRTDQIPLSRKRRIHALTFTDYYGE